MANPTGFKQFTRCELPHRPISERIKDWYEIDQLLVDKTLNEQAARCMDCGIPFCHGAGCPVKNRIPEFNDLVYRGQWRAAADNLHSTNNFPEVTGRICPAPCETACTLAINDRPVNIKHIELQIAERAFREGWVEPILPPARTGKRVAVIGSGPAGMAAAQQINRAGHETVVFEKDDRIGGLLRYGIPDFKLDKSVIDRRLEQMSREGIRFRSGVEIGRDMTAGELRGQFDAVCLCMGAGHARPMNVLGDELRGVHLAMEFLSQQNRRVAGDDRPSGDGPVLTANGKHVIVVGGGDTGSDCVGTSIRQGAISVTQLEILPKPPDDNNDETPWPIWPKIMRTSSSQEEGCGRRWSVLTKELRGDDHPEGARVRELYGIEVNWLPGAKGWEMKEIPGTEFILPADLVLIAMGFLHVVRRGIVEELGVKIDSRGNVVVDNWMTSVPGVFAGGDTVRGASLVVHAINHGRIMAAAVDKWLQRVAMSTVSPSVIVLAGPNGSGKTTSAPKLLRDVLGVVEFVNADTIAQGLAAFSPEIVALEAGAIMLSRLHRLAEQRRTFAFETTLAGRSLAPWFSQLVASGYEFHLVYLWLPSADLAVARVVDRVRSGGHDVPEDTIRRRYQVGLRNFFRLYSPLATRWQLFDNANQKHMRLIAKGSRESLPIIADAPLWHRLRHENLDDN